MVFQNVKFRINKCFRLYFVVINLFILALTISCNSVKLENFEYSEPVNTSTRTINYQEKRIYSIGDSLFADNEFDGARLNGFDQLNDSTLQAIILPENEPINPSPHYAFRLWSKSSKRIYLRLNYPTTKHRYWPKLSSDGKIWKPIDSTNFKILGDSSKAHLILDIDQNKLWIAAQEINNAKQAKAWAKNIAEHNDVRYKTIGKSKLNRDLIGLDIYTGDPKNKDLIVILSRQHPPEVTGYLAMQTFVKELLKSNRLSADFRKKYRILVFPMLNPDGVDLGHWRHNAGGIDLNRDWAYYRQEEVRTVANYIVKTVKNSKNKVILGLDFHSTQQDVYYTFPDELHSTIYPFKDYWLTGIDNALVSYTPDDQPGALKQPISKGWFYKQFRAESITYEIGDETPRDFIKVKAETAAREMMKLLILR